VPTPVYVVPIRKIVPPNFQPFVADCVPEEHHEDTMEITQHPVEQGASIADHAYKLPAEVTLNYIYSSSTKRGGSGQNVNYNQNFLQQMYQNFLALQAQRVLFQLYTGKRYYPQMLIKSLSVVTDPANENILNMRILCKELIIVTTTTTQGSGAALGSASNMTNPQQTAPIINSGQGSLPPGQGFDSDGTGVQSPDGILVHTGATVGSQP
jgi:hypothetical protein